MFWTGCHNAHGRAWYFRLIVLVGAFPAHGAFDADAGTLYADCPLRDEGGVTREVRDGGTFYVLSNAQAQRAACLLETCEARRLQLEPVARDTTWQAWVLGLGAALLVGMVVGAVLAVYVGR